MNIIVVNAGSSSVKLTCYGPTVDSVLGAGIVEKNSTSPWSSMGPLKRSFFLPAVILGALAGFWLFRYASNNAYRMAVDGILLLAAVILWVRP
jgi:hypothetical protein